MLHGMGRRGGNRAGCCVAMLLATVHVNQSAGAATIFSDDFHRSDNDSLGATPVGGFVWSELEPAASAIRLNTGQMRLGGTDGTRRMATVDLSTATGYESVLGQNAGLVTWSFNMSGGMYNDGLDDGKRGTAFLLAGSQASLTEGSGYAVVYADSADPAFIQLRLVKFTGGLDADVNLTSLITTGSIYAEGNAHRFGVKVTYEPASNEWLLYAAESPWSGSSWPDPATALQVGSATDGTYTLQNLAYTGMFALTESSTVVAYADNISLTVIPEPQSAALFSALALAGYVLWRRKQASP